MKDFTILIRLWLVLTIFCIAGQTYAEDSNAVSKILWERDFDCGDDLSCSLGVATFSKSNNKLLIAGTSFRPRVYSEGGKLWFWEVDQNGERIKNTVLADVPESCGTIIQLGYHLIKGLAVSSKGDIFVAGKVDGSTLFFTKMDRQGKKMFSKSVPEKSLREDNILILRMINLPENNFLLFGRDSYDNGLIIKIDSEGNRLWKKTYDLGRVDIFSDGVPVGNEGDFLIVGCSAEVKGKFPAGLSNIYVLRCDAEGRVLSEEFFTGGCFKMPQVCQLDSGNFVVAYDKSTKMGSPDHRIKAFTADLKTVLWEKQVVKLEMSAPVSFKIMAIPGGNFIVGNCINFTDLRVYEYDKEGNKLSSISMDKVISRNSFSLACTEEKAFIISQNRSERDRTIIKVIAIELSKLK